MKKILLCLGLASVLFGADNNVKFEITPTLNYNYFCKGYFKKNM